MLNFYGKHSKDFVFVFKTFEKYRISTQNIWKVSDFCAKHSASIKVPRKIFEKFRLCMQKFQIYLVLVQNICKISNWSQNICRIFLYFQTFKKYQNPLSNCIILVQKTPEILHFYAKHSINIVFCKEKILETSDSQNIRKV